MPELLTDKINRMTLIEKFASRIDNDKGYDNLQLAKDLAMIAEQHQNQGQTLPLDSVSGWRFVANQEPLRENELYTVLDKFGNIHENIIWGNSGFMNEPWKFFDNDKVKAINIIAYR